MTDLTNPVEALGRGKQILSLLGSFWSSLYGGYTQVSAYTRALNYADLQSFQDLMELVASISRFEVPIYHKTNWKLLTIRQSDQTAGNLLKYGDGAEYGTDYSYGVSIDESYDYPVDATLKSASFVMDRITEPLVLLTQAVDYVIDTTQLTIRFRENPFENDLIIQTPIFTEGSITDYEINLWMFMADYDWQHVYNQFGYALDIFLESSENYRTLVNAVWDACLICPSRKHVEQLLAVMCDTPLVIEDSEIIEDIYSESTRKLIITDKNVYAVPLTATLTHAIGQTIVVGTVLTEAFRIIEPYQTVPSSSDVPSISLPVSMLLGDFQSDITFTNASVPVSITKDNNSRVRVEFALGGLTADTALFWNTVHTNGTAIGAISLAQLMDSRYPPAQTPEPMGDHVPNYVNPMDFLLKNVLGNNALVILLEQASFGPNALHTVSSTAFKKVIPPSQVLIMLSFVTVSGDTVPMNGVGNTLLTGYSETIIANVIDAPEPLAETSPHSFISSDTFTYSAPDG